jgi:hypothetical protein
MSAVVITGATGAVRHHRLKIVFPLFIVITRCSSSCIVITGNNHRPAMTGHAKKPRRCSSFSRRSAVAVAAQMRRHRSAWFRLIRRSSG